MWEDPIVAEIHRYREEYAARFDNDLEAIWRDLCARQHLSGRRMVSLPSKPVLDVEAVTEHPTAS